MDKKKINEEEAKSVNGGFINPSDDKCPKCGGSYFVKKIKNNEVIRNAPEYKYVCVCNKCGYMWPYKE